MTDASRAQPPRPFPHGFQPCGAVYDELPLAMPRKTGESSFIAVLSREDGVTKYKICRNMDSEDAFVEGLFDTRNEWLFLAGIYLHWNPEMKEIRVGIGDIPIVRIVTGDPPADDPTRSIVDHANGQTLNNRADNLHWVTQAFNAFNRHKEPSKSTFLGVNAPKNPVEKGFGVRFQGPQGKYKTVETAALVYNLLARLEDGDR